MVTALMVKPGEKPCEVSLCDDPAFLNAVVSVGAIVMCTAAVLPIEKDVVAIYAWDGVVAGLQGNRKVGKRILAGIFYIVRVQDDHLRSLSSKDIAKYTLKFQKAEEYSDDEVMDSWFDDFYLAT